MSLIQRQREPAAQQTARRGPDAVTVLTAFLFFLFLIPASEVLPALGSAGHPATILAIAAMAWWVWHHFHRTSAMSSGGGSVRVTAIGFLAVILLVYVHAMVRPLPPEEVSPADSGLLRIVGAVGIVLVSIDGLTSVGQIWTLARRFVFAAGLVAGLGVLQYATGQLWVDHISIPGLAPFQALGLDSRGGLIRPSATATTPIEFAVVLAVALPIAIAVARHATRHRLLHQGIVVLIGVGLLLSISRTAIVGCIVAFLVLLPAWSARTRAAALAIGSVVLVGVYLMIPGLASTFVGLFASASNDPSVQSRTGSYGVAGKFIAESPWLGRGYGTFLPRYWILDNLYLQITIEAGVIGLLALLALSFAAIASGRSASRDRRLSPADRELARALMAAMAAATVSLAFFDAFSFPESAGSFFLVAGLCGAMHRARRST